MNDNKQQNGSSNRVGLWRLVRRLRLRLQILANEITYMADMHHCAEMRHGGRNVDSLYCGYRTRWLARSLELHQKLHALSLPNNELGATRTHESP